MISRLRPARKLILATLFAALLVLAALMPLRFALGIAFPKAGTVSAKMVNGNIWNGKILDLKVGSLSFGNVHAGLRPMSLLLGQMRYSAKSMADNGQPQLSGDILVGGRKYGVANMTGELALSNTDARLPLMKLALQDVSIDFDNKQCRNASGSVRLTLSNESLSGLGLDSGFLGTARCESDALLLPLVSQSAMERADIRLTADGNYSIALTVQNENPEAALVLSVAGFAPIAGGYRLVIKGQL